MRVEKQNRWEKKEREEEEKKVEKTTSCRLRYDTSRKRVLLL